MRCSAESNIKNMPKAMAFYHLQKKKRHKSGKKLMNTATKTEIDASKTASKKIVPKTA